MVGRIDKDDYELGVIPENDIGNFDDDDIYEVELKPDFCQALQPSNQVEFGVYWSYWQSLWFQRGRSIRSLLAMAAA